MFSENQDEKAHGARLGREGVARASQARGAFLHDPRPTVFAEVLTQELHLEPNRITRARDRAHRVPPELARSGTPFVSYAAVAGSNLTRTAMRAVALSVSLEEQAGRRRAAIRRLGAFLRLFAATDYARPLVRERRTVLPAAEDFHRRRDGTPRGRAVATLLPALLPSPPRLGARQAEVLRRLDTHSNPQIAAAPGLTRDGVRYHVRTLFATLRARDRRDAVRRARALGLLPVPD